MGDTKSPVYLDVDLVARIVSALISSEGVAARLLQHTANPRTSNW